MDFQQLKLIDASAITKIEPYCRGLAAIWSPYTGVIDYISVAQKLSALFQECNPGNRLYLKETVHKISYSRQVYTLITTRRKFECQHIITCAGLQSDRVAKLLGLKPSVRIVPFRGDYYHLKQSAAFKVKGLIYPVPDPRFPIFRRTLYKISKWRGRMRAQRCFFLQTRRLSKNGFRPI
jgi:L-2-hydroxyglutarate oxidase